MQAVVTINVGLAQARLNYVSYGHSYNIRGDAKRLHVILTRHCRDSLSSLPFSGSKIDFWL